VNLAVHLAALAALAAAAWLAVRVPRRLFTEAGEGAPDRKLEWGLVAGLAVFGVAVFEATGALTVPGRLVLALCAILLCAVVYADLTYLIIPDLYSAALFIAALAAPWRLPLVDALIGAAIAGALLFAVSWAWRRFAAVEGLGFGDVKLAAAIGALLGAQAGLLAISLSAGLAAVLVYGLRLVRGREVAPLVPYGAALALAGGGFLAAGVL
jgi:leader peptidase (prepilin peptidase)/N-methyltransferase